MRREGDVRPRDGRGRGSAWGFPHLVELLAVRAAQRDGESLDAATLRRGALDDPALERYVAERLGAVPLTAEPVAADPPRGTAWVRYPVAPGVELQFASDHPLVGDPKYFSIENWELPGGLQNRLHLLARRIAVPHPRGGVIDVTAPLPPHMQQSWNLLGFDARRYDPIEDAPET